MSQHRWSDAEIEFVKENVARMKDPELLAALMRITGRPVTIFALRMLRRRLNLRREHGSGNYTPDRSFWE